MKLFEFLMMAVRSLLANKLRSSLTMLGIVIGVGAVITLMSVGRGAQASITSGFQQMGANVIYIQPRNPDAPGLAALSPMFTVSNLTFEDGEAMANIPNVIGVAPTNENFVEVTYGDQSTVAVIEGTTPAYLGISNYALAEGDFISDRNVATRDAVVVLGSKLVDDLFDSADALGQKVKIKGVPFTVVGVLAPKGGTFLGFSNDSICAVPITTYQSKLFAQRTASGAGAIQAIALQVSSSDAIAPAVDEITTLLRKRHRLAESDKNDFVVVTQAQALGLVQQVTGVFTIFLGAIASISLVVGSIGIMNIMLVSVTERTREIGIRKAVGAKRRDILLQFLFEAAVLSFVGGGIGIAGGWLMAQLISQIDIGGEKILAVVSPDIVILAISVSVFIGLVSGIYPAMRAARLNPIEALRYG
ncbi:MAG: ABC transporter permease [Chloroflexota bacterium]|nr:ABC transporter permease [Chloroflexota bacterium]